MRIPFPFDLSVGTDIIAHHRLLKPHASTTHFQRLASRFLHPLELSELDRRFPEWRCFEKLSFVQKNRLGAHVAGRWAAKEAAKKAWGATMLSFKDLRVETQADGQVQVVCQSYREPRDHAPDPHDHTGLLEQAARLTISHDGSYAVATVIAAPLHADILANLRARIDQANAKVTPK